VFAKAREKARQSNCTSNEKQLGLAFAQYTQDYDESFPFDSNNGNMNGWAGELFPYIKSYNSFSCPNDTTVVGQYRSVCSYAMNANVMQAKPGGTLNPFASVAKLSAPASTVLLCEVQGVQNVQLLVTTEAQSPTAIGSAESWGNGNKPAANGYSALYATGNIGGYQLACIPTDGGAVHDLTSIYLAADGHVKTLRPELVSGGRTPAVSTTAQDTSAYFKYASGTSAMKLGGGSAVTLTFSPL
jgi:hypothetical protein